MSTSATPPRPIDPLKVEVSVSTDRATPPSASSSYRIPAEEDKGLEESASGIQPGSATMSDEFYEQQMNCDDSAAAAVAKENESPENDEDDDDDDDEDEDLETAASSKPSSPVKKVAKVLRAGKSFIGSACAAVMKKSETPLATKKPKTKTTRARTVSGVWEKDHASLRCRSCKDLFNLSKRRHHCRNCGLLVCDFCSGARAYLPSVSQEELVRVCDSCLKTTKFQFALPSTETHREFVVKKPAGTDASDE